MSALQDTAPTLADPRVVAGSADATTDSARIHSEIVPSPGLFRARNNGDWYSRHLPPVTSTVRRDHNSFVESSKIVTGPSFTSDTCMFALNTPVATFTSTAASIWTYFS